MSLALLFPGQGAQSPGFLHVLPEHDAVRRVMTEASDWLGCDALTLDGAEALAGTEATQLSLLIAGCAFAAFMAAEKVIPEMAAGMSVGAFAAAVAAGALELPDALRLVKRRAQLMESAFPGGTHGMAVIEGLRKIEIERLLGDGAVTLANENSATQFVVAGSRAALQQICSKALEQGAHRAQLLAMSVPSHSELLRPAAAALLAFAENVVMKTPEFPIYSNSGARVITSAEVLRKDLAENMARPVLWQEVMISLEERGATTFLEAPPGHTLTYLVHANLPAAKAMAAGEIRWDVVLRTARRAALS